MVIRIPETIYAAMVAHVSAGYPNEACGALGSKDDLVVKHYPTANAAQHPDDFSEIAPQDLLRISYDIDEYDGETIYYHSHPHSEAYPSPRDIEWAKRSGYLYLIFSHQHSPEPPYARVFAIDSSGNVTEGSIERV
ncbi:MAG: M67 family metallopeptidase [Ktedonobacteraceae bacterium]|nr:M67 family metallopeptidase [Ktedonobacteraceae bacterium]